MADRSAAKLMGRVFKVLASNYPGPSNGVDLLEVVRDVWAVACSTPDFSHDQMQCDESLTLLSLARTGVHPDWPDEEPGILYAQEDGVTFREAPPKVAAVRVVELPHDPTYCHKEPCPECPA